MAKINTKINYDEGEDILSLSKSRKIKASIDVGDFIIDIDHSGFVAGIEILNASDNLKVAKEQLKDLQKASMAVTYRPNYVYVTLIMILNEKEKEISIPLTIDLGHGTVRTERTNFAVA
jgi:uncharacterized protein YuzE